MLYIWYSNVDRAIQIEIFEIEISISIEIFVEKYFNENIGYRKDLCDYKKLNIMS